MDAGSIRLSVAIVHADFDAERRAFLAEIRRKLGHEAEVVKAPRADPPSLRWRKCYRPAYIRARPPATHHLVLADDMIPCPRFYEYARAAIAAKPDQILVLFSMRRGLLDAQREGLSWIKTNDGAWGGAIVMPVPMVHDLLGWEAKHIRRDYGPDDGRVKFFAEARRLPIWITAPSLLQHAAPSTSLLGHSNRMRTSPWVCDGTEAIEWNTDYLLGGQGRQPTEIRARAFR